MLHGNVVTTRLLVFHVVVAVVVVVLVLWHMARAGRGKLEDVDKDSLVGVTWIKGQHPMVDVLLGAF